ncbi:hypothetical protein R69927_05948 [Paraburkholderia domus]|nr:hypothetical protein [Paraburkholderia domus]CAE6910214.1 hypothetical protein R69927_05948 [Paraburkholderia domus]
MTTSALIDLASLIALWPADQQAEIAAKVELESEPLARLLQESSYCEMVWRQRQRCDPRGHACVCER